jgi:hypothetical protein
VVLCPSCRAKNRLPAASSGKATCAKCHADLRWLVDTTGGAVVDTVIGAQPGHVLRSAVKRLTSNHGPRTTDLEPLTSNHGPRAIDFNQLTVDGYRPPNG